MYVCMYVRTYLPTYLPTSLLPSCILPPRGGGGGPVGKEEKTKHANNRN